jgi:predicted Zn-dependent protease
MARFADHPETLTEVATLAEQVGEWEAAATLWELLRTRRPDDDAGWRQGALAAAQLGRTQEAAALRAERDRRASESEVALLERADLARRERRWPDLAELGDDLRLRFPHLVEGYAVGAIALGEQNRLEDAASLLDAMEARFPGTPALAMGRAWLAH